VTDSGTRVLCADIGNTSVKLGLFSGGILRFHSSFKTVVDGSEDEYAVKFAGIFALYGEKTEISGAIISSVVPPLTNSVAAAIRRLFGVGASAVGPGVRTGLDIRVENASQIGADIVADVVGAFALVSPPFAVIDFGTATTVTSINRAGALCGVAILPGIRVSLASLSERAAELSDVSLHPPKALLGRNTADSMNSGVLWSAALAADGYIEAIAAQDNEPDMKAVVTGGLSKLVTPLMRHAPLISQTLVLDGLYAIWCRNARPALRE